MAGTRTTVEVNGFAVRELRIRSGLSVVELAEGAGVKRAYIARIEVGLSQRVSPRVFKGLLSALSLTDRRVLLANPHGSVAALDEPA